LVGIIAPRLTSPGKTIVERIARIFAGDALDIVAFETVTERTISFIRTIHAVPETVTAF
jgi:hypothetical protein